MPYRHLNCNIFPRTIPIRVGPTYYVPAFLGTFSRNFGIAIGGFHQRRRSPNYINWVYFGQIIVKSTIWSKLDSFLSKMVYWWVGNCSSVASPICQEGQSEITFPILAFSSRFFPIFPLFFPIFRDFPSFSRFLTLFRCQGGTLPLAPLLATPLGNWAKNWYRESPIFEVRQAHPRTILVRVTQSPPPPPPVIINLYIKVFGLCGELCVRLLWEPKIKNQKTNIYWKISGGSEILRGHNWMLLAHRP